MKFVLEQLGGPPVTGVTQSQRGRFSYRLPHDRSYAGESITWRLTAIGRNGARSTSTLAQTIVRSFPEVPLRAQLPAVYLTHDRGGMYCRCTGNIVSHRWEVLPGVNVTDTKISGGRNNNFRNILLNFAPGDVFSVYVTVTDANGATSTDYAHVVALDSSQLERENNARFSVQTQ